jgi:hypothetical protein
MLRIGNEKRKISFFKILKKRPILQEFSNYIFAKDPDIIICIGDYGNNTVLHYLFARAKIGFNLQLGREIINNDYFSTPRLPITHRIKGRICISRSYRHSPYFAALYGLDWYKNRKQNRKLARKVEDEVEDYSNTTKEPLAEQLV